MKPMIRMLLTLAALAALGGGAFWLARRSGGCQCGTTTAADGAHDHATLAVDRLPELEWLRRELSLSDTQMERIKKLHMAYMPHCREMCRRIDEAERRVREVSLDSTTLTPALQAALEHETAVRRACQADLLQHLYATAACMDDEQAARYRRLVVPGALHPAVARITPP